MTVNFFEQTDDNGYLHVEFEAKSSHEFKRVLTMIKRHIPQNGRSYDPNEKQWIIAPDHVADYMSIKQAIQLSNPEQLTPIDRELTFNAICEGMKYDIRNMSKSHQEVALYVLSALAGKIQTLISFYYTMNMFAAYHPDNEYWYYENGSRSKDSPQDKDAKSLAYAKRRLNEFFQHVQSAHEWDNVSTWDKTEKQQFREDTLRKYNFQCFTCGKMPEKWSGLDMHRVIPGKDGGLYVESNVVILCETCHSIYEGQSWDFFNEKHNQLKG